MKKEAKKEAAYSALCELLGYEEDDVNDNDFDDDEFYDMEDDE